MAEKGPASQDSKKSEKTKLEKLREEAQYEKEKGNNFVKQEKWDEAISCYNRAIELVKDDAIYYANRGLCYLKKENLNQAEKDCTEALRLDPTYVKALQRRATAREKLGSLRAASNDLMQVLKLEPHNLAAKKQLEAVKARIGTKGPKTKSSANRKVEVNKPVPPSSNITELPSKEVKVEKKEVTALEKWKEGIGENINVIKPVKKPPHLRSKRALKLIPIYEIPLGKTTPVKPTNIKIIEIEDTKIVEEIDSNKIENVKYTLKDKEKVSPESDKLIIDTLIMEKDLSVENMVVPVNSVQFMAEWKYLKGREDARSDYLSIIDPAKIPSIFANALESEILSELLAILAKNPEKYQQKTVTAYLKAFSRVKRFSALAMFLSNADKECLNKLLEHCKTVENCSEDEINDVRNKYEL